MYGYEVVWSIYPTYVWAIYPMYGLLSHVWAIYPMYGLLSHVWAIYPMYGLFPFVKFPHPLALSRYIYVVVLDMQSPTAFKRFFWVHEALKVTLEFGVLYLWWCELVRIFRKDDFYAVFYSRHPSMHPLASGTSLIKRSVRRNAWGTYMYAKLSNAFMQNTVLCFVIVGVTMIVISWHWVPLLNLCFIMLCTDCYRISYICVSVFSVHFIRARVQSCSVLGICVLGNWHLSDRLMNFS